MEHWTDSMKGNAISPDEAMELLAGWHVGATAIGMLFHAAARATVMMRTRVHQVSADRLELLDSGCPAGAGFGLQGAGFQFGPMLLFPRWPLPPPVNVTGLSVWLSSGGWLFLWDARAGTPGAELIGPGLLSSSRMG
jgi:hypothetical protein